MKVKQQPDDFYVEELTDRAPESEGPFTLYRLEKRGWTTLDALQAIRRRWRLHPRQVGYGGLKDRHAHTIQYLTIYHGPARDLEHHQIQLTWLGAASKPFHSSDIRANRFRIRLRDLTVQEASRAPEILERMANTGLPNYFDDQRFGSLGDQSEFVARHLVLKEFEQALKLALTAPYAFDKGPQKKEKNALRSLWGDWPKCKEKLGRGHARSLVDYLVHHPTDFKGAITRMRADLRSLYLSAYQSHIWNRSLARWIRRRVGDGNLTNLTMKHEPLPVPTALEDAQRAELMQLSWPLPSARTKLSKADLRLEVIENVVAEEGFTLAEMKITGIREAFFSRGDRPAWVMPGGVGGTSFDDELHEGRKMLELRFDMPRGSYATLVIKRLQAELPRLPALPMDS